MSDNDTPGGSGQGTAPPTLPARAQDNPQDQALDQATGTPKDLAKERARSQPRPQTQRPPRAVTSRSAGAVPPAAGRPKAARPAGDPYQRGRRVWPD